MSMDTEELNDMLEQAAERGAQRALEHIGLHDENAPNDVRELRGLLDAWRDAKKTARRTIVRWVTTGVLIALAAWAGSKFNLFPPFK